MYVWIHIVFRYCLGPTIMKRSVYGLFSSWLSAIQLPFPSRMKQSCGLYAVPRTKAIVAAEEALQKGEVMMSRNIKKLSEHSTFCLLLPLLLSHSLGYLKDVTF